MEHGVRSRRQLRHRACARVMPSPFTPPFLAHFASPELEHHFQRQQTVNDIRVDQAIGLLCFVLVCHTFFKFLGAVPLAQLLPCLAAAALFLVPYVWASLLWAPESYAGHRLWVAAVLRVLPDMIVPSNEVVHSWQPVHPKSLAGCLSQLALFAKLPNGIVGALGFRLPFFLHLLVHAIPFIRYIRSLPTTCALPIFQQPTILRLLRAVHQGIAGWGFVQSTVAGGWEQKLGAAGGDSSSLLSSSGGGSACTEELSTPGGCTAALGTLIVLLHFLVPTMALISRERGARASFWAAHVPPEAATQQGQQESHSHSALQAWAIFLCLLPPMLCMVYQALLGFQGPGQCFTDLAPVGA